MIIGAAFGKIVSSLVADVLMPAIGLMMGGINFSGLAVQIGGTPQGPALLKYGVSIQTVVDVLIIAACVFLIVKAVNSLQRRAPGAPPEPPEDVKLLREIRDLLRSRG